jgi:hypothetical protein
MIVGNGFATVPTMERMREQLRAGDTLTNPLQQPPDPYTIKLSMPTNISTTYPLVTNTTAVMNSVAETIDARQRAMEKRSLAAVAAKQQQQAQSQAQQQQALALQMEQEQQQAQQEQQQAQQEQQQAQQEQQQEQQEQQQEQQEQQQAPQEQQQAPQEQQQEQQEQQQAQQEQQQAQQEQQQQQEQHERRGGHDNIFQRHKKNQQAKIHALAQSEVVGTGTRARANIPTWEQSGIGSTTTTTNR